MKLTALLLLLLLLLQIFLEVIHCQDEECLKEFKASVSDPQSYLDSWTFPPSPSKGICGFAGITCLHENDSTVYGIDLQGAALGGTFPQGLNKCTSLTSLDISSNSFTGGIPDKVCSLVPFLVKLVLRGNSFTGELTASTFANCSYLNVIDLSRNSLTGGIPGDIGVLPRLNSFDVSSNSLSGTIPVSLSKFPEKSFQNNKNLCGTPLRTSCQGKSSSNKLLIAGVSAGGAIALLAAAVVLGCFFLPAKVRPSGAAGGTLGKDENKWAKRIRAPQTITVSMFEQQLLKLKLTDLLAATNEFSPDQIIGSGRTGVVYKASFPDGSVMAIKRLKLSSPHIDKQFRAEMETLGRLRHRNLVPLLGYCVADSEKLLVYKLMPNGSLKDWLHGERSYTLDWPKRLRVGIGAARGLAWLHHSCNPRIIHRNISSSSILLDEDFEARITDFGLARLMNPVDTHISTCVNGDFGDVGYVAPEYVRTLVATARGDVYSFGVVLLELITGQRAVEVETEDAFKGSLVEWVAVHSQNGTLRNVVDRSLVSSESEMTELMQFLKIGFSCCAAAAKERPSAFEVYQLLRAIGQRYHFSDQNDEMPLGSSGDSVLDAQELIVSANAAHENR